MPIGIAASAFFVVGTLGTVVRAVPIGPILGVSDYGYKVSLSHQVAERLNAVEGRHVVFVKYGPTHSIFDECVHNAAAVDAARMVWCRAIGPDDDMRVVLLCGTAVLAGRGRVAHGSGYAPVPAGRPPASEDLSQKAEVRVLRAASSTPR